MIVFAVIGMVTCALLALAALAGIALVVYAHAAKGTSVRHWRVIDGLASEPTTLGYRWTFRAAKRLASRQYGTRIQDHWSGTIRVAGGGWSEIRNGFEGRYLPLYRAAKMLQIDHDGVQGSGRWDTLRAVLGDAGIDGRSGNSGGVEYNAAQIVALARSRGTDPFAYLAADHGAR